jgi:hypothetical protein
MPTAQGAACFEWGQSTLTRMPPPPGRHPRKRLQAPALDRAQILGCRQSDARSKHRKGNRLSLPSRGVTPIAGSRLAQSCPKCMRIVLVYPLDGSPHPRT